MGLPLTLFMTWILTKYTNHTLATDDAALQATFFDGG